MNSIQMYVRCKAGDEGAIYCQDRVGSTYYQKKVSAPPPKATQSDKSQGEEKMSDEEKEDRETAKRFIDSRIIEMRATEEVDFSSDGSGPGWGWKKQPTISEGEIKKAASDYEKIACCDTDHPFLKDYVNDDIEAGAEWAISRIEHKDIHNKA